MAIHLIRRVVVAVCTAWFITSAVFVLSRGVAGQQPRLFSGESLTVRSTAAQRRADEAAFQQRLGLAAPVFYFDLLPWRWHGAANQYHRWLQGLSHGRLGVSYRDGVAVETHLSEALRVTLPLTLSALVLSAALGLSGAVAAARRPGARRWLLPLAYALDSLPLFVVALLLLLVFANPDVWPLFPSYGLGPEFISADAPLSDLLQRLYHLVLPVISLTLLSLPALLLPTEAALRQQSREAYATTARAKGVSASRIWWRHLLPNALPVFITRLSDLVPGVVAGAVVAEVLFALPGMGRLLAEAAATRDLPILLGGVLLITLVRLLAWLLADVVQALVNPRHQW